MREVDNILDGEKPYDGLIETANADFLSEVMARTALSLELCV